VRGSKEKVVFVSMLMAFEREDVLDSASFCRRLGVSVRPWRLFGRFLQEGSTSLQECRRCIAECGDGGFSGVSGWR
jgi:hypothetical protein